MPGSSVLSGGRGVQSGCHFGQHTFGLRRVEIRLIPLSDTVIGQKMVFCRLDSVAGEATANAGKRATVNRDDAAPGLGKPHQLGHITTDTRDA